MAKKKAEPNKKSAGRPSNVTAEVLAVLRNAFKAGMTDEEACAIAEISHDSLYRYQRAHPDFAIKKAAWKKQLIGQAKFAIALDIVNRKDVKTSKWYLDRESEHAKAAVERAKAEAKRAQAEAEYAKARAAQFTGSTGNVTINIERPMPDRKEDTHGGD